MSVADNLARAIGQRTVVSAENERLLHQISMLTGLHRVALAGWRAAMGERDRVARCLDRMAKELDEVRLQCQKEARTAEDMRLRLSRADVQIKDLERRLLEPLQGKPAREYIRGIRNDDGTVEETRVVPETTARSQAEDEVPF